jgi:hypothetical protein
MCAPCGFENLKGPSGLKLAMGHAGNFKLPHSVVTGLTPGQRQTFRSLSPLALRGGSGPAGRARRGFSPTRMRPPPARAADCNMDCKCELPPENLRS